jgi:uncharacterized membrane protein
MHIKKIVTDYFVEVIGLAVFVFAIARIVIILYSEPLYQLPYYIIVAVIALFFMNYKNVGHHAKKVARRISGGRD